MGCDGNAFLVENCLLPFIKDLHDGLREGGFSEDLDGFALPPGYYLRRYRRSTTRKSALDGSELAVIVSIFVGLSVARWAVSPTCDTLWEKLLGPAVRKTAVPHKADCQRASPFGYGPMWTRSLWNSL